MKGYCAAMDWEDGLLALAFAREKHAPQRRKGGQPYIIHPLTMASHAVSLGLRHEDLIVCCLLHDVVEDCDVSLNELPISSARALRAIEHMTHGEGVPMDVYYAGIRGDEVASLTKLLDRCDNVSTMAGVFSPEKLLAYVDETRNYVLPLLRDTKDRFPQHSNALFVLKYHIVSVIDGLEKCLSERDYKDGLYLYQVYDIARDIAGNDAQVKMVFPNCFSITGFPAKTDIPGKIYNAIENDCHMHYWMGDNEIGAPLGQMQMILNGDGNQHIDHHVYMINGSGDEILAHRDAQVFLDYLSRGGIAILAQSNEDVSDNEHVAEGGVM